MFSRQLFWFETSMQHALFYLFYFIIILWKWADWNHRALCYAEFPMDHFQKITAKWALQGNRNPMQMLGAQPMMQTTISTRPSILASFPDPSLAFDVMTHSDLAHYAWPIGINKIVAWLTKYTNKSMTCHNSQLARTLHGPFATRAV